MTRTITETITEYTNNETNVTRMVLRPSTLNMRNNFREVINNRLITNNPRLPSTPSVESIPVIDRETIIELNNSTTSEIRLEFMENIINNKNNFQNLSFLIENSPPQIRTYLHTLLIRSDNNSNINEEDLFVIGNIFLYTVSNLNVEGLILRDIIENIIETVVILNTNQVFSILDTQVINYNNYLNITGLVTEVQMAERIALNRRRMLYAGIGLLGMPPIGGVIVRSLVSSDNINSITQPIGEVIRLRDIWDASLKKIIDIIKK